MSEPEHKIVVVNEKGLFCRGAPAVLIRKPTMEKLRSLLAPGSRTSQADRDLLQWGYDLLDAFPKFTAPFFGHLDDEDIEGPGMFVPFSTATTDSCEIPIQAPTREAFGWDALAAIHAELPKFRRFIRLLDTFQPRDGFPDVAFLASPSLVRKLRSTAKLTIKTTGFAERFVDSECFVVYINSPKVGGGFLDAHGSIGSLATARSYPSSAAASRAISLSSDWNPSCTAVIRGKMQLTDVCVETAVNLSDSADLRKIMASLSKRAIQDALTRASVEELKARLAVLEAQTTSPLPPAPPAARSRL